MKTYFVTGATGAVGAALVPRLLEDQDTQVRLLIRAKDRRHLQERLEKLLQFWEIDPGETRVFSRIKAVKGDMTLPKFGMEPSEYESLGEECTHIIHAAGNVRMNLSLEEARKSAVSSTHNIIELAKRCMEQGNLFKLEFVSTIGVGGRMQGEVPERWITEKREFHNTYEQAKAEAEEILAKEIQKGLPATVHRPSMVVGDSETGKIIHFQIFYHLCEFLSGRRTFGFLPNVKGTRLDIIPVDYVTKTIIWSSGQKSTAGEFLHLCSGPRGSIELMDLMKRVCEVFQSSGMPLPKARIIPVALFKKVIPFISLFVPQKTRRAMKALPVFFNYLEENQVFENHKTIQKMETSGIPLPLVDDYLEKVLLFYLGYPENR